MQNFNYHTHTYRCGHADLDYFEEDYIEDFIKNLYSFINQKIKVGYKYYNCKKHYIL